MSQRSQLSLFQPYTNQSLFSDYYLAHRVRERAEWQAADALRLERRLSDLVHQAYGLTPADIDMLWRTAPPRMPIPPPPTT